MDGNGHVSGAMGGPCMWYVYENRDCGLHPIGSVLASDEAEALARARGLGVLDCRRSHAVIRAGDVHLFNRRGERRAAGAR